MEMLALEKSKKSYEVDVCCDWLFHLSFFVIWEYKKDALYLMEQYVGGEAEVSHLTHTALIPPMQSQQM